MARFKRIDISVHDLQVGDMAEHIYQDLDARPVVDMDLPKERVWISIFGESSGPFPLYNYRYYRVVLDMN